MSGKKLMLDMAAMEDAFFADSALIGLSSQLPAPALCWMLNRRFDLSFERKPELDICVSRGSGQQYFFPIYEHIVPLSDARYLLYRMRTREEYLMQELRQLDFLWMFQGGDADGVATMFAGHLRNMPEIQLAQVLDMARLKQPRYLLV
jgi:hypothetical protein